DRRTATDITRFVLDALGQVVRRSWSGILLVAGEHFGPPVRLHFVQSHGSPRFSGCGTPTWMAGP
ncbi:MAG TPA: hypothetical protein VIJ91_00260, partial [Candidatus Dormibacteraeota bacterium]